MVDESRRKVLAQVDQQEAVELASALVRIPSFSPQETPVADFLAGYFRQRGYDVELQEVEPGRSQIVARLRGKGGGESLMLLGHMDINALARNWKRDPWKPQVEGGRLYGAGALNMKGGVAAIISAAEAIRRSGVRLNGDLVVACVAGETQGGEGTVHLLRRGVRADMAVVAEPFGTDNLTTVHAGIVHLAIHTYGVTGHISTLEGTVNAVVKMTKVIGALQQVRFTCQPYKALPALPRLQVGSVIGGRGESYRLVEPPYVPDLCTIIVDVHFVPGQTVESIVEDLKRALEPLKASDPELRYEIELPPPPFFKGARRLVMTPLDVPVTEHVVQAVARSFQQVTGRPPRNIGVTLPMSYSGNDTCHLWNAGIPCLLFGPAGGRDESGVPDEYVSIGEMVLCAKVLALTALDVCDLR
ncbi:MAG: M20 family metallopeptidase [Chloroflexi bacterium]|nr:M20 family metallopeptidase [Chloroflexota bacterium]